MNHGEVPGKELRFATEEIVVAAPPHPTRHPRTRPRPIGSITLRGAIMSSEKSVRNVRVVEPLTCPADPQKGLGPRIVPGVYAERDIREWLNAGGQLSEANFDYALQNGWIEFTSKGWFDE